MSSAAEGITEEWDYDTDEIKSIDSEDLYESRPNRWRGQRDTWLLYTKEDRGDSSALEQINDRNLSIHLYNVFALKTLQADESVKKVGV
jgi:hypothetical protein